MTNIKAASVRESALPLQKLSNLCADYINGFCRPGDKCKKSHEVCRITDENAQTPKPELWSTPNYLSLTPNLLRLGNRGVDNDGPGYLSSAGARHQNDHVDIRNINILPTADEILCPRSPYVPKKDLHHGNYFANGQARLMDANFRQLRFDSTESIIDICYHASQQMVKEPFTPSVTDYNHRYKTPRGNQYSVFRDAKIIQLRFNERAGIGPYLDFSCPTSLRGQKLHASGHLEKGMLVALIGMNKERTSLSVTFLEVGHRESTESTGLRTKHQLSG